MRTNQCTVSFNLWTAYSGWFWSVASPDRHAGAIGVAGSEAEALGEIQLAIERLPQWCEAPLVPGDDSISTRSGPYSKPDFSRQGCRLAVRVE